MKHRMNGSVRRVIALVFVLAVMCASLSSCSFSFSFSLEDMLEELKAYINGTEVAKPPVGFVESRENETYAYDVYSDHVVITAYLGEELAVEIPKKIDKLPVKKLASLTFYEGVAVESVIVPEGVTELEENAFYYCTALKSVTLPKSLTVMGDKTFSWCSSLETVTVPEKITAIPAYCFNECTSLRAVYLPDGIESVGARAFSGCKALEALQFGDALLTVGGFAFRGCSALTAVRLPGTCELTEYTFDGISESFSVVTAIDSACWEFCTALEITLKEDDGTPVVTPETSDETSSDASTDTSDELIVVG